MDPTIPNTLTRLFVTEIYRTELARSAGGDTLLASLDIACRAMIDKDEQGQAWSRQNNYIGYTSYGTAPELSKYHPVFNELKSVIDQHVAIFARQIEMDLGGKTLKMEASWVNALAHLGAHSGHFHPHSVISGTFYVSVPDGAGALTFEDPRLPLMMNAPRRNANARPDRGFLVSMVPLRGTLLLWESWLRHEVPANLANAPRISISFNYN